MAALVPLTSLTEEERAQAQARFEVLRPFLEGGVPLARVARQQGVNQRTAQRWAARYRQHGLAGLADQPRADRGGYRSLPPDQV